VNNGLQRFWKEAVGVYLEVQEQKQNRAAKPSVRMSFSGLRFETCIFQM
jgi:hypothetical protein